jgi:transcriptional regulator with XRE-family HTH domain
MEKITTPSISPFTPPANALQATPRAPATATASAIDLQIAERLKTLRNKGGMTLQDLATLSGVSRAMISKIERAEASATAALLHKLCTALQISLSDLLVPAPSQHHPIMRRAQRVRWQDPATGFVREIVTPRVTASRVEVVEVSLPPKALVHYQSYSANGPVEGVTSQPPGGYAQYIVAQTNGLRITQNGSIRLSGGEAFTTTLIAGDAMHMEATGAFSFENVLDTPCKYLVILEHTK